METDDYHSNRCEGPFQEARVNVSEDFRFLNMQPRKEENGEPAELPKFED